MTEGEQLKSFSEPTGGDVAGFQTLVSPRTPYDIFMESEGIPIVRDIGAYDAREVNLAQWQRYNARGAFIQLLGTEGLWGMYVLEIPARATIREERHIYEEIFYVVEGYGTTEVCLGEDDEEVERFEWQPGSVFAIPLNARHRLVNATASRALLIAGTTAPAVFDLFRNDEFIFGNPVSFTGRTVVTGGKYFSHRDELLVDPIRGRALRQTNFVPDVVNCSLPLDNQRGQGYRRVQLDMARSEFGIFVGQFESGQYSKAHYHPAGPVLICLGGKGYTFSWPRELGPTPWSDGHGDRVRRQDYVAGGMVAAVPEGEDCFHQHFGVGREPLRVLALLGPGRGPKVARRRPPGAKVTASSVSLKDGGRTIGDAEEDPFVRQEFERMLAREDAW